MAKKRKGKSGPLDPVKTAMRVMQIVTGEFSTDDDGPRAKKRIVKRKSNRGKAARL